jgi:hypothetical protein
MTLWNALSTSNRPFPSIGRSVNSSGRKKPRYFLATFVGRQYRITVSNTHYRVDLVFYHRILRCFVLIDLKITDVQHHDIGQMNLYPGYFATEENAEGDNPPIGITLTLNKD